MAQLIKLRDFISRYETDIFRYPSQYIRLKRERWKKIKASLESPEALVASSFSHEKKEEWEPLKGFENYTEDWLENNKKNVFTVFKKWFDKSYKRANHVQLDDMHNDQWNEDVPFANQQKSEAELKQMFLDQLFLFQINWASSTIRYYSYVDEKYYQDDVLKYFLQHFPDTYFLLYHPILLIKKASIDLDMILISPIKTYCISLMESDELSVYKTKRGRYWYEVTNDYEIKRINPMFSLNRTEGIVKGFYNHYNIDMPIEKVVLSRTGYLERDYDPSGTIFVDKRNYSEWYSKLRNLSSPIKYVQLKGAQALLQHSQSTYSQRIEWEDQDELNEWDQEIWK